MFLCESCKSQKILVLIGLNGLIAYWVQVAFRETMTGIKDLARRAVPHTHAEASCLFV